MGIERKELAKILHDESMFPGTVILDNDSWDRYADRLMAKLDISPRRAQEGISAAEAAKRGFNQGKGAD